ncbi:MAG: flagellar motor protein MotB [Oligoflexales bacterium]|nr:flagellar motor protein MotB [Oligoflexales bacterium]
MDDKHDPLGGSFYSSSVSPVEETWLTSYGDLVTNLLVFFVLLVSASKISAVQFEKIKNAFSGPDAETFSIARTHDTLVEKVEEKNISDLVEVVEADQSIKIVIKDKLLFDLGKTEIKTENLPIIEEIVQIFQELPEYARIAIEGHTDDNPVGHAQYRSNWHLSVLRALSVLEVFDRFNICKKNCELRGFGEYQPSKPNRNEEGTPIDENQSQNRRVVIRIY